ncbi:hypothetical protein E1B28_011298 [Marasmius oreades]|uniref:Uncharacterized protein n=1 Tax=Marasmius oreades TaxID=181124 RepID=A0A9P7RUI4_9AGAR|nr:uncharacterized protein E1B28_011298 [Marasmius oreades]KAG7089635.1 hypothetical protein E1B28_011298 [Marasmius oreades]
MVVFNTRLADQKGGDAISLNTSVTIDQAAEERYTPEGYEYVFGPLRRANNALHYMGFVFLDSYDPKACAQECNKRGFDSVGGACKYFNIWRAVNIVTRQAQSYTCAMYYIPTDASTATNAGQGNITVDLSRGYRRSSLLSDGGFDSFQCPNGEAFCFTDKTSTWTGTSPFGGHFDASIFHFAYYAYYGTGVGLLGSADGMDKLPGTLSPSHPLQTKAGGTYAIQFFLSSVFSGPVLEKEAFVSVVWNGNVVKTFNTGYASWAYYEVIVTAAGDDRLSFVGGKAPAFTFIDEVYVFLV